MSTVPEILGAAVERVLGAPAVIRTADPRFGDYQANGVLAAAKAARQNPRQLAEQVIAGLDLGAICEPPTVAGAGFINFRLKPAFVAAQVAAAAGDPRLGVPVARQPQTVVLDFSSPNVAKPMHVGHIRSTILGDCLARVLRFLGHRVITDNHLGDWGTQFGMLIVGWKQHRDNDALARAPIGELERLYKLVNSRTETDPAVREEAKAELVKLQRGDAENQAIWQQIIDLSRREFDAVYERLGVRFDHTLGESAYNARLPGVVAALRQAGLARESEGAICVFFEDDPALKSSPPFLIQKGDGAFLYGTTDLATLAYRIDEWHPDTIVYVTDARQKLHFQQLFAAARKWQPALPVLRHVWFGSILGEDGKPLKTRSGENIKLGDLLDEAEQRAVTIVNAKNPDLPEAARRQIARVVGLGAVKYADLSQNRTTDYLFSWDKMLAMQGNTAPYMQYAYVRVRSIFRKAVAERPEPQAPSGVEGGGAEDPEQASARRGGPSAPSPTPGAVSLEHPAELDLAKQLLRFADTLTAVAEDDKPNWLTGYLYDLAGKFSVFYDSCPVLQSAEPLRSSRLLLCRLTADVIKQGLNLLGIDVIEQM